MFINSIFFVIVSMIFHTFGSRFRSPKPIPGKVLSWAPPDDGLSIDFNRQIFYIDTTPKPITFEIEKNIKVICKVYYQNGKHSDDEYVYRMDLLSMEEKVRFESLITNSCNEFIALTSIGPSNKGNEGLQSPLRSVAMVFKDRSGVCHERSYEITVTSEYTADVTRSVLNTVGCPKQMVDAYGSHQTVAGIVMDWTPEGKELIMDFTKDSFKQKGVYVTIPYTDHKSKLECREVIPNQRYLGTIFAMESYTMALILDRVELLSCEAEYLKTFFVGFDDKATQYYIEFKTTEDKCFKRYYKTTNVMSGAYYNHARLTRETPTEIECPTRK